MKVYDLKSVMEEQATRIQLNTLLSQNQRSRALTALKAEMEKAVTEAMGEKAFKVYQQQSGQWLDEFSTPANLEEMRDAAQSTQ